MSLRLRKEPSKEQNDAPGSAPEYGAIFMSSSTTKRECLSRRLFGLPASQTEFVKQVKVGMILFLFEFESRKLHGVFQARSDGALNIVPHAYQSSGRQFPAQVEFTRIWHCRPLGEDEFRDAIRENYFTAYKFNFGLSEIQVRKLLMLFSLKKVEKPTMEIRQTKTETAKPVGQLANGSRREARDNTSQTSSALEHDVAADQKLDIRITSPGIHFVNSRTPVDDGRSITISGQGNEPEAGREFDIVMRNEYSRDTSSGFGRVVGSSRLGTINKIAKESLLDSSFGTLSSTMSSNLYLENIRCLPEYRAANDRLENEYHDPGAFAQADSSGYPSLWSNLNKSADYSTKPVHSDPLVLGPPREPLQFHSSMDTANDNLPYQRFQKDTIITSTPAYNPDAPNVDFRHLSSFGVKYSSLSVEERALPYGNHLMDPPPSERIQSFAKPMECAGESKYIDDGIEWGDYIPLSTDICEYHTRTNMLGVACSGSMETNPFASEAHTDLDFVNLFASAETGNRARIYSTYLPSGYPSAWQDTLDHRKIPQYENNKRFAADDASAFNLKWNQLGDHISYAENESQKTRPSVFTRLALPPKDCDTQTDSEIDDVMAMLQQCHEEGVKSKKSRLITRNSDAIGKSRMKEPKEGDFMTASKGMTINEAPAFDETEDQSVEQMHFIDFKRRSEVRKNQTQGCAENHVSTGTQQKKRKLVRPNFSKDESSSKDKGVHDKPLENALISPVGTSICENAAENLKGPVTNSIDEEQGVLESRINSSGGSDSSSSRVE